jgi:hypothetical protein
VILDDASRPNLFSDDDYLRGRQAKSILCLPLIKHGLLTGLLYLFPSCVVSVSAGRHHVIGERPYTSSTLTRENLGSASVSTIKRKCPASLNFDKRSATVLMPFMVMPRNSTLVVRASSRSSRRTRSMVSVSYGGCAVRVMFDFAWVLS